MAWFNRPEGFTVKSFDTAAPSIRDANDLRLAAFLAKRAEVEEWAEEDYTPSIDHEVCCGWVGKDVMGYDCPGIESYT